LSGSLNLGPRLPREDLFRHLDHGLFWAHRLPSPSQVCAFDCNTFYKNNPMNEWPRRMRLRKARGTALARRAGVDPTGRRIRPTSGATVRRPGGRCICQVAIFEGLGRWTGAERRAEIPKDPGPSTVGREGQDRAHALG
jgi:hypothetical protein